MGQITVVSTDDKCDRCGNEIGDDPKPITANCEEMDCSRKHVWHLECTPESIRFTVEMEDGDG